MWYEYLDKIDIMLRDSRYSFADSTLQGIRNWVVDKELVTDEQKEIIDNLWRKYYGN